MMEVLKVMFRKINARLLVFVLVMNLLIIPGLFTNVVYAAVTPFYEHFTNFDGNIPSGWTAGNGAQITKDTDPNYFGNNARFTTTAAITDVNLQRSFSTPMTGQIMLQTSIKPSYTNKRCPIFFFKDSTNKESFMLSFNNDGYIVRYTDNSWNKVNIQSYSANQWYDVKVMLDTSTKKYDVYIDGVKKVDQANYANTALVDLKSFKLSAWDSNNVVNFDNIRMTDASYEMMRMKRKDLLTAANAYQPTDPNFTGEITSIQNEANTYWNSMDKSGGRTYLWSDAASTTDPGHITKSYDRLRRMALGYAVKGSNLYGNTQLRSDIISAMDWLYTNRYNDTITEYGNWWEWDIGTAIQLNDVVVLLYDAFTTTQINNYMNAIDHFVPDIPATDSGANRVWRGTVIAMRGANGQTGSKVAYARDELSQVFDYVTSEDGFYTDGSFIQHDKYAYTMGYGKSLLTDLGNILYVLQGTGYAVTDTDLPNVYEWIYNSFFPQMYKGAGMSMTSGREIARDDSDHEIGHKVMSAMLTIAQFAPSTDAQKINSMVKYLINKDTYRSYVQNADLRHISWANNILSDSGVVEAAAPETYKQFIAMDRAVQYRTNYAFGLSMYSNRIANFESINGENLKGWYTGDGMTYLYNADLSHYADNYWNTVDMYRLPGTTVDTRTRTNSEGNNQLSSQNWVGGVNLNDKYGATGMRLAAYGSTLGARKSWFMFDDEIVAIGSGITSTDSRPIETIIENRRLNSSGNNVLIVNNTAKSSTLGWNETMSSVNWMHLKGTASSGADIGYYFPTATTVKGKR